MRGSSSPPRAVLDAAVVPLGTLPLAGKQRCPGRENEVLLFAAPQTFGKGAQHAGSLPRGRTDLCGGGRAAGRKAGRWRQGHEFFPRRRARAMSLEVEGDAGDVPEPGAGSGRPKATSWRGAACEEGPLLAKRLRAVVLGEPCPLSPLAARTTRCFSFSCPLVRSPALPAPRAVTRWHKR